LYVLIRASKVKEIVSSDSEVVGAKAIG